MSETRKHPLWKNVIVILEEQGVDYNTVLKVDWLEKELDVARNTKEFAFAIHGMREHFEQQGMYLTCLHRRGEEFYFRPAAENWEQMQKFQTKAIRALKRGVILGTNTPLDTLDPENRKRHEKQLEQMATRAALMMRQSTVLKILNGKKQEQPRKLAEG
jgi:hypothetical protein